MQNCQILRMGMMLALDRFATFLGQCVNAMTSLSHLGILENIQMLIIKLPVYLQDRWRRETAKIRGSSVKISGFKDFVKFVQLEAKTANDPVFSRGFLGKIQVPERSVKGKAYGRDNPMYKQNNCAMKVASQNVRKMQDQCTFCKETHDLDSCQSFLKRSLEERRKGKEKSMCYACYKTGHRAGGCLQQRTCKTCNGKHPTSLHDPEFASKIKMKKKTSKMRNQNQTMTKD